MEPFGTITQGIDWALVVLYAFWLFFAGLIFYLRREDRREGYPLVDDVTGRQERPSPIWLPDPKKFVTGSGDVYYAPRQGQVEPEVTNAVPANPFPGAPLVPVGDKLSSGVGPAAYAMRKDHPDVTSENEIKLVPMRRLPTHTIAEDDADPRGMEVVGADGQPAGVVEDLWVDRSEMLVRYIEVRLDPSVSPNASAPAAGEKVEAAAVATDEDTGETAVAVVTEQANAAAATRDTVLLPMNVATIAPTYGQISTSTILASQFANVPRTKDPEQVTLLEEDKIMAYFTGGMLYATPSREEPLL
jgi:photosynthetic reaction center H subunit